MPTSRGALLTGAVCARRHPFDRSAGEFSSAQISRPRNRLERRAVRSAPPRELARRVAGMPDLQAQRNLAVATPADGPTKRSAFRERLGASGRFIAHYAPLLLIADIFMSGGAFF